MIRTCLVYLLYGWICLSMAACVARETGRQQEPAGSQVEAPATTATTFEKATVTATAAATRTASTTASTRPPEPTAPEPTAAERAGAETVDDETFPAPDDDGIYARNTGETVALPACFDFDDGATVVPPDAACDFSMLPGPDSGTVEIYPQAGAQLAYGGVFPQVPTLAQCAASNAFSGEREIVAPMAAMYVCYRTGEGRTGYLHFTDADLEQAGTLAFDWLTFAARAP